MIELTSADRFIGEFMEEGACFPDTMLTDKEYRRFQQTSVIACVESVPICKGQILLGMRTEEPAKGFWYTIGGRMRPGESFKESASRIAKTEIGIEIDPSRFHSAGFVNQGWANSANEGLSIQGLTNVNFFYLTEAENRKISITDQSHSELRFFDLSEVLDDLGGFHPVLKEYARYIKEGIRSLQ